MKITDLSKSYDGRPVLSHITLTFEDGGIYALMGTSGRGKTTLLHILMGLTKADKGSVSGLENKRFSAVFQENRLCDFLTAAENIMAVQKKPASVSDINTILAEILPMEALNQPVKEYSGGMKRRVAIARALLAPSDILVMDEPLTGLDEKTKAQVISFILRYRNGRTLLFTTHQEEDIQQFSGEKVLL